MKVAPQKVVTLTYVLKVENKGIVDQADESSPFTFIHGIGQTLHAFDENLNGLSIGESFSFELEPEDGYGDFDAGHVVEIPAQVFQNAPKDMMQIGMMVPMQDTQGNPLRGTIKKITPQAVTMDFNHPLAGDKLAFSGKVIAVRDADPSELEHGHVHGPGGHHH